MLGLGSTLTKVGKIGLPIVTDNLVLHHKYDAGEVHQVSTGAAYFNGSSDYIDTGNHFSSTFNGNFSIAAWVKPIDGRPSSQVNIAGAVDGSTDQISVVLMTTGQIQFYMKADGGIGYVNSSAIFADGVGDWTHIACVATLVGGGNTTMKIYINGVEDNPTTGSTITSANHDDFAVSETLYIGARNTNSTTDDFLNGYICNVGIWDAALSQTNVKSIMWKNYADLTTTEAADLVSWWNLDNASGTLSGGAWVFDENTDIYTHTNTTKVPNQHVLDNNLSLGSNLVEYSNGDITKVVARGENIVQSSNGAVKITFVDGSEDSVNGARFIFNNPKMLTTNLTSGAFYQLKVTAKINTGIANLRLVLGDADDVDAPSFNIGTIDHTNYVEYTTYFKCTHATKNRLDMDNMDGAEVVWVKDLSLKLVTGNIGTLS